MLRLSFEMRRSLRAFGPFSQPFLEQPGRSARITFDALKFLLGLHNDLAEMLVQTRLLAKESFPCRVPASDEDNPPSGVFIRYEETPGGSHRPGFRGLVRASHRDVFRELFVERVSQLVTVATVQVQRPRGVPANKPRILATPLQSVDESPDWASLFSKLNVIMPLSVEPLAGNPHFIV
jgi:hypothetical protein